MFNRREYSKKYYGENRERILAYHKQYRKNNTEECLERTRKWQEENKEHRKEYGKNWRNKNRENILVYAKEHREEKRILDKEYRIKHRKESKEYRKLYYAKHRNEILERGNRYRTKIYNTNLKFNLSCRMSIDIRISLKSNKNGLHWENLVGYNVEKLKRHLSKTIPKGYCWQDYMEGKLHIDHKIPISAFNYTKPEHFDFKCCWALKNLQLLPAKENIVKSNKLYRPFQASLKLEVCNAR